MNYLRAAMFPTANLEAALKDAIAVRDLADSAVKSLQDLLKKLAAGATAPTPATPYIAVDRETPIPAAESKSESSAASDGKKPSPYADSISYHDELVEWSKNQMEEYTIADFHSYLASKYGEDKVNDQSIRNPFRRLTADKVIYVSRPASGRRPAYYRTINNDFR